MKRKLETIQENNVLNTVYAVDEPGPGNANHEYVIECFTRTETPDKEVYCVEGHISFQKGPRNEALSKVGVLDVDLLEIVRDRLISFQSSEFACRENAIALTHIEDALLWLDKRVKDRARRGVLGTNKE